MKQPHKHADLIKAWADGAEIQFFDHVCHAWQTCQATPQWEVTTSYRIKPEVQPDITKAFLLENHCFAGFRFTEEYEHARLPRQQWIRAVFEGETGQIKSVEVLHE
jgi:hypothetical protein